MNEIKKNIDDGTEDRDWQIAAQFLKVLERAVHVYQWFFSDVTMR